MCTDWVLTAADALHAQTFWQLACMGETASVITTAPGQVLPLVELAHGIT
jgi:hypothetical protein